MDSKVEEIMDSRLSSLPDDIIHKILSTMPMKDVIKTSVLSSRWRYIWTSMPCLNFTYDLPWCDHWYKEKLCDKLMQFVKYVMTRRNNQIPVSSVKLNIHGYKVASWDIQILIKYMLSHNVQQVDVECMDLYILEDDTPVTLFSSQSLKRLTIKSLYLTASSTSELPALTTLYLSCVELHPDANTLFSKCPNLKNLTLDSCQMKGSDSLSICHERLSNLTLEHNRGGATAVNVVAPQLENLTIRYLADIWVKYKHQISAPNLISLIYEGYDLFPLSTNGFHSLEKVNLCNCSISSDQEAANALKIVRLFQQIKSVKFLKLNLEILELLSSHVQVISHHPPPFANLKSLDVNPKTLNTWKTDPKEIVNISTEVINYLLDSSQEATFTMFSRQEALADMKATKASEWMDKIQTILDRQKDIIQTNLYHIQQPSESMYDDDDDNGEPETLWYQIMSRWSDQEDLIHRGQSIVFEIMYYLKDIERVLTQLPASKRVMLQPRFSSLCTETNLFVSKMTERINIRGSENLNKASDRFHELTTSLQSSNSGHMNNRIIRI